jgi:hypothetical protein
VGYVDSEHGPAQEDADQGYCLVKRCVCVTKKNVERFWVCMLVCTFWGLIPDLERVIVGVMLVK